MIEIPFLEWLVLSQFHPRKSASSFLREPQLFSVCQKRLSKNIIFWLIWSNGQKTAARRKKTWKILIEWLCIFLPKTWFFCALKDVNRVYLGNRFVCTLVSKKRPYSKGESVSNAHPNAYLFFLSDFSAYWFRIHSTIVGKLTRSNVEFSAKLCIDMTSSHEFECRDPEKLFLRLEYNLKRPNFLSCFLRKMYFIYFAWNASEMGKVATFFLGSKLAKL